MKHTILWLAVAAGVAGAAKAATAPVAPENLLACARMPDPGERLRCYDTQMAAMEATPATAPPAAVEAAPRAQIIAPPVATAPPSPAAAPASAPTVEQKFGAESLPPTARSKVEQPDRVMRSTIASIKQVRPKLWLIVLANGQIWLQDGTQITMFFRAGYDVRIERGLMEGEYRMSTSQTGDKNWVKVSRVQ